MHSLKVVVVRHIQILLHRRKSIEENLEIISEGQTCNEVRPAIINLNIGVDEFLVELVSRLFRDFPIDMIFHDADASKPDDGRVLVIQSIKRTFHPKYDSFVFHIDVGYAMVHHHFNDVLGREGCIFFFLGKFQVSMECTSNETD